jgi:hypothetical protein
MEVRTWESTPTNRRQAPSDVSNSGKNELLPSRIKKQQGSEMPDLSGLVTVISTKEQCILIIQDSHNPLGSVI